MGKKLAFWGDCNGYGYKIIRILEELGGINVSNYGATEVTSLYYVDDKSHIKGVYNGDLDKEKYVVMTYHDFIAKYPFQVGDIVYTTDNHEEGKIVDIVWNKTIEQMWYLVDFENTTSWVFVDDIFSYEAKDNSDFGTVIKPMKVKSNAVKLVDNKVVDNLEEGKTMNKKLAIKGHPTRGKEVIELLKMMGGRDSSDFICSNPNRFYSVLNEHVCWDYIEFEEIDKYIIFTLEEFLEKYPYKVGDTVYTKSTAEGIIIDMFWDGNEVLYQLSSESANTLGYFHKNELKPYKETDMVESKIDTAKEPLKLKSNAVKLVDNKVVDNFRKEFCECCGSQRCSGQDDELEYCERFKNLMDNSGTPFVENYKMEEIKSKREYDELRMPLDDDDKLATEVTIMGKRILPPDGYLVGKITQTDNGMIVEYVNKEPKYPTTYAECCRVLGISDGEFMFTGLSDNEYDLFNSFVMLRRCRNAYWKIAGEQMGLGKHWEPRWNDSYQKKWIINFYQDEINLTNGPNVHFALAFPTEEMRDAFYENFKDLIEQCKELL